MPIKIWDLSQKNHNILGSFYDQSKSDKIWYFIFEDNIRKIGKEKGKIFWDAHKNLEFITKKSQHYI
jgi:hypothetical protein